MARISCGKITRKRHKKYIKLAQGFRGYKSKLYVYAKEQLKQGLASAYVGRKCKKRYFANIFIFYINNILKGTSINYSILFGKLRKNSIFLNRKSLANMARINPMSLFHIIRFLNV